MKKVLLVHLGDSPFVRDDRALLEATFQVEAFQFGTGLKGAGLLRRWYEQQQWLKRHLPGTHAVLGWFADYHLVLPVRMARQTGVPTAVCVGGFDANVVPSLNYGVYLSYWRAPLARYVLRNSTRLLPVAEALIEAENAYAEWPRVLANGVRAHVAGPLPPVTVLPTGYKVEAWPPGSPSRSPSVLSIAFVDRLRTWKLKGLDVLAEAARLLPEVPFTIVGVSGAMADRLRTEVPANVMLLPPAPRPELAAHYRQASVYAHLSRSEGFPNVVCEAMLCGCVPVVSPVGAMPEIVGDAGFTVATPRPDEVAAALQQALAAPAEAREKARARIATRYPIEKRQQVLLDVMEAMGGR